MDGQNERTLVRIFENADGVYMETEESVFGIMNVVAFLIYQISEDMNKSIPEMLPFLGGCAQRVADQRAKRQNGQR